MGKLVTVRKLTERYNVAPSTIRKYIYEGKFKSATNFDRRWYIDEDEAEIVLAAFDTQKERDGRDK